MKQKQFRSTAIERAGFWGRAKSRLTSTMSMATIAVLLAVVVGVVGNADKVFAWGPNRPTFTMQKPSDHVTFNSIVDDTQWGDERNFAVIKDITSETDSNSNYAPNTGEVASSGGFSDVAKYVDGHTYMVKMIVHNNAAANLNLIAKNVRAKLYMPSAAGSSATMQGIISADNCGANTSGNVGSPCAFWDEVYIKGDSGDKFSVSLVPNSARYYNNVKNFETSGFDNITSGDNKAGYLLGYETMDGNIQGCFQYAGYITFLIKADESNVNSSFEFDKKGRIAGTTEWKDEVTDVKPGDTIEYRIRYQNTGSTVQTGVIIKDSMAVNASVVSDGVSDNSSSATGLTYIPKSTVLKLGNSTTPQSNDEWRNKGLNIGSFNSKAGAYVEYKAKVPEADQLQCGENTFQNTAKVMIENGNSTGNGIGDKIASSTVVVKKECSDIPPVNDKPKTPENPGVPSAGVGVKTAVVSFVLFAISATVLIAIIVRNKKARR